MDSFECFYSNRRDATAHVHCGFGKNGESVVTSRRGGQIVMVACGQVAAAVERPVSDAFHRVRDGKRNHLGARALILGRAGAVCKVGDAGGARRNTHLSLAAVGHWRLE